MARKQSFRRTRIVCTIGPATCSLEIIKKLIMAGMDVARLNLSHGSRREHIDFIDGVRRVAAELGLPVSLLIDLPGPKYRTGPVSGTVTIKRGDLLTLTTRQVAGSSTQISVNLPSFTDDVRPGDLILVDDGAIQLRAEKVENTDVVARVLSTALLSSGRGIVIPGGTVSGPFINKMFLENAEFAASQNPDFIALSFVSRADDVASARRYIQDKGGRAAIVAKIERHEALKELDGILEMSDAVMVARGDLGVDIPLYDIPLAQKEIIRKCNRAGKPVITATQMLESMVYAARPTRAEVTDVANAIFDGTDAVMLSGETAIGKHPVAAVKIMAAVARRTENALPYHKMLLERGEWITRETDELIAYNACYTAETLGAKAIVAFTTSGSTVKRVAKYRPRVPVLALTPNQQVFGQVKLSWAVQPALIAQPASVLGLFAEAERLVKEQSMASRGDLIVITGGVPVGVAGTTNLLKVETVT